MAIRFAVWLYALVLGFTSVAWGQKVATFSPSDNRDLFFSVVVADTTASSGSGPVFFQIKAPSTLQWVGLAQGSQMTGANMFVLYSSSSTNITLSPRSGKGHILPEYNSDTRVTLLDGSGIKDGVMTANVLCESCIEWHGGSMDPSGSSTSWIYAYKEGVSLNSDSATESIQRHDNRGNAIVDLSRAKTNSENPFLHYDPTTASTGAFTILTEGSQGNSLLIAHGAVMAITFVLLFPAFALLIPLPWPISVTRVHAPFQIFTLGLTIIGMGIGIRLAVDKDLLGESHPIIGIIVVALLVIYQPIMGILQHRYFRRTCQKSVFAHTHRWLGRSMIILGIINGGLGFRLARIGKSGTQGAAIAYSIIAGVMVLTYLGVHLLGAVSQRRSRDKRAKGGHEASGRIAS
ncbi:hypothetical protein BDV25DRAFT_166223 [Aspergillus avenaceus]|uniref:Cellobiose dehydrogenase cytochrome domain-containing protein n=1 Tax=Aspergillus avenaceus TaxID=36643 RepID=A0A5N6TEA3_ASPAV|nr:hypothetical protein BDV25DRAFT_166223 [Aspergillus avenaceus]